LLLLLSLITWVPGLLLYFLQVGCEGWTWMQVNLWLARSILLGLWILIVLLSLLALALSAWVKWKIAAGALILGVFFLGAGFGEVINEVWNTHYGDLLNLSEVMHTLWADLFRYTVVRTHLTLTEAWGVAGGLCLFCLLLLAKRIRAFEVVK
jgi:ABC-2 type transport system permease protein